MKRIYILEALGKAISIPHLQIKRRLHISFSLLLLHFSSPFLIRLDARLDSNGKRSAFFDFEFEFGKTQTLQGKKTKKKKKLKSMNERMNENLQQVIQGRGYSSTPFSVFSREQAQQREEEEMKWLSSAYIYEQELGLQCPARARKVQKSQSQESALSAHQDASHFGLSVYI